MYLVYVEYSSDHYIETKLSVGDTLVCLVAKTLYANLSNKRHLKQSSLCGCGIKGRSMNV